MDTVTQAILPANIRQITKQLGKQAGLPASRCSSSEFGDFLL